MKYREQESDEREMKASKKFSSPDSRSALSWSYKWKKIITNLLLLLLLVV